MGGGKSARVWRRDRAPRASRHPAGPHPQGRHVGCLRCFAPQRRDRLEAAADARGTACLHGLDGHRARLQPVTGTKMNPSEPYPRDLIGYGARAPHPHWPGEALIAVSLVLNCEEGAEACVLHGDAHSESVLTDLGAVEALPGARNLNVESNFEYGSRVGFWEIIRLLKTMGAPATVYAVCMALERNPEVAAEIARSGFEVACHGQRWIDHQFVAEEVERAQMLRNIDTITRLIGRRPVGWYTGRPSPNTRRLVVETGGFLYDSDAYNDDLPYWTEVSGCRHLIVPYSFDTNDSRLQRGGDFSTGDDFFTYCRDAFDWLYRIGAEGRPRMMSIGLHGRIIGRSGRIGALARLLEHIQRHEGVWLCNRAAIAQHWITHHAKGLKYGPERAAQSGAGRQLPVEPERESLRGGSLSGTGQSGRGGAALPRIPPAAAPLPRAGLRRCAALVGRV